LAFAFGGFMTAWIGWPHTDTSLWLPLICLCILRAGQKPGPRSAVLLAFTLAMPILAGHPGMAAHVLATAAAYALWIVAGNRSSSRKRQLGWLLFAGFLGAGLSAIQFMPTLEWLGQIERTLDLGFR